MHEKKRMTNNALCIALLGLAGLLVVVSLWDVSMAGLSVFSAIPFTLGLTKFEGKDEDDAESKGKQAKTAQKKPRRPKGKSSFDSTIGTGTSSSTGTGTKLGVALLRQIPSSNMLGTDLCFSSGYVGSDIKTIGGAKQTSVNGAASYCFINYDGESVSVNPRVFEVTGDNTQQTEVDLARISAWSPGNVWGRALNYLRGNTSLLSTMDPKHNNMGYLMHWLQASYQAGAYMRRLMLGPQIENQYFAGRSLGRAGIGDDHTHSPYYNLYKTIKPLYTQADAHMDETVTDYTLEDWLQAYLTRLSPSHMGEGAEGGRSKFVVQPTLFMLGYSAVQQGFCMDGNGNPTLFVPEIRPTGSITPPTFTGSIAGKADVLSWTVTNNELVATAVSTEEDDQISGLSLPTYNQSAAVNAGWNRWQHDQVYVAPVGFDATQYNGAAPRGGFVKGALNAEGGSSKAIDPSAQSFHSTSVDLNVDVLGMGDLVGMLWERNDFVGLHNLKDYVAANTAIIPQQTLLNATPSEFALELEAWTREYPSMVLQYQDAMGATSDILGLLNQVQGTVKMDYKALMDEKNLHGKYTIRFNPVNRDHEAHRGPGHSVELSERYYEHEPISQTGAGSIMDLFSLGSTPGAFISASSRSLKLSDSVVADCIDHDVLQTLFPQIKSMGQKAQRPIIVQAGSTIEGTSWNGVSDISGSAWWERVVGMGTQTAGIDFSGDYPSTDVKVGNSATLVTRDGVVLRRLESVGNGGADTKDRVIYSPAYSSEFKAKATGELLLAASTGACEFDDTITGSEIQAAIPQASSNMLDKLMKTSGKWKEFDSIYSRPPMPVVSQSEHQRLLNIGSGRRQPTATVAKTDSADLITGGSVVISEDRVSLLTVPSGVITTTGQSGTGATELNPNLSNGIYLKASTTLPSMASAAGAAIWNSGHAGDEHMLLHGHKYGSTNETLFGIPTSGLVSFWTKIFEDHARLTKPNTQPRYTGAVSSLPEFVIQKGTTDTDQKLKLAHVKLVKIGGEWYAEGTTASSAYVKSLIESDPSTLFGMQNLTRDTDQSWAYHLGGLIETYYDAPSLRFGKELSGVAGTMDDDPYKVTYDCYIQIPSATTLTAGGSTVGHITPPWMVVTSCASWTIPKFERAGWTLAELASLTPVQAPQHACIPRSSSGAATLSGGWTIGGEDPGVDGQSTVHFFGIDTVGMKSGIDAKSYKVIPNMVNADYNPEFEVFDAAVLYQSTDPRLRYAWMEGRLGTPFHGEMSPLAFSYIADENMEIAKTTTNPLTDRNAINRCTSQVCRLSGINSGKELFDMGLSDVLGAMGFKALTPEVIYAVEEAARYID